MTKLDSIKIRNAVLKLKKSKPVNVVENVFLLTENTCLNQ